MRCRGKFKLLNIDINDLIQLEYFLMLSIVFTVISPLGFCVRYCDSPGFYKTLEVQCR